MAEGDSVVIEREDGALAHALVVIAVLLVVANANDYAENAIAYTLAFALSAERGFGLVFIDIVDAIFDEVGRRDLVHFQLGFGAIELGEQGVEERVSTGCYAGCG